MYLFQTYRVQNGPLFHSSRRISNAANTQLYGNLLQRHSNQIRRHQKTTSFRATRVQNTSPRRYIQAPQRHASFDSIVRHAARRVTELKDFHLNANKDTKRINTSRKNPNSAENAEKSLNINLQLNDLNSVNGKDNMSRRKITIKAKNFRNLRISHKDANIVINRIASNGKVQNSRSPISQDHRVKSSETQTSILQKSKDALRTRASHNLKQNRKDISSLLKLNKKYDSVTLPPAAWYIITAKPRSSISTTRKKSITNPSPPTTGRHPVAATLTSHKIASSSSAPITQTALPVTVATEEIDLPDFPDLPDTTELPDTAVEGKLD